ncbi:hypothetical protein LTR37_001946 [Vermiconidia calcicola]|uniref:Uncharacterized protein n=1 Tax=Vermiconidia calcicola TaxID=1690605 RepID=A0ACC3NVL3_9PEZI|nr:hypothetical protein LTR37_001946 [Vermiconidia calcicola]
MSLTDDRFPSSSSFDLIASSLSDEGQRQDAIKKGAAIFAFTLKNKNGETADWYIDLKETGKVVKGATAPDGKKPNVTLILSDDDFAKMMSGKANAQNLFMKGKLKIKGDVMKATKMEPILTNAQVKAKL